MANFVPKYVPQAIKFDGMIKGINTSLLDSIVTVNGINEKVNIDASVEDALALNTILFAEKIKTELENKVDNNETLSDVISTAAEKFDREDYEEFLMQERLRKQREQKALEEKALKEQEKEAVPDIVPIKGYKEITAVLK